MITLGLLLAILSVTATSALSANYKVSCTNINVFPTVKVGNQTSTSITGTCTSNRAFTWRVSTKVFKLKAGTKTLVAQRIFEGMTRSISGTVFSACVPLKRKEKAVQWYAESTFYVDFTNEEDLVIKNSKVGRRASLSSNLRCK